jgi:son of sevenless-like protein
MVNYINRITHWVAWDIVSKVTLNDRQRVLGFWIDVAKYCKGNGDFNGSWAVFGAFGLHAVARLTQTWEKLSRSEQSRHKRLTSLFDPRLNFGEYRKQLDRAQLNGPTVPILAFLPKDIIRFETDPTFTDERLVDFDKMRGIYSTLQGIAHCKNETLPFQRNEDIWECFLSLPLVPESRLEDYSYRAEPKLSSVMSSK